MQIVQVKIQSDSLEPTIIKIISESKSKALDTVRGLYYSFPKSRDNVILEVIDSQTIGE